MRLGEFMAAIHDFKVGIPGLVGLFVFDRGRNLLLYGESDEIASSLEEISFYYARLADKLEKAHACRKDIGNMKRVDLVARRMTVSVRILSDRHIAIGECMGQKGLGMFGSGAAFLGRILRRLRDE